MIDKSQARNIIGQELHTQDGTKIGKVGQVYLDNYRDQPEWVTVNSGLFGTSESFVPLAEALVDDAGIVVPYTKDQIKGAPNVDDSGQLSEAEEQELYRYYGIPFTTEGSTFADPSQRGEGQAETAQFSDAPRTAQFSEASRRASGPGDDIADEGHDTSGPATGNAITRSEEQLHVGTEQVETGKARLRKYIVTEDVTTTVPVSHEEVRLEHEPITDENRPAAVDGPDLREEEHEVVLTEERVVTSKENVPVERVRLGTETVTKDAQVDETVRKEKIDLDTDDSVEAPRHRS